ncbi:MAG: tRNA (guanosine(37)-N1)-methyltransferase TrmD [Lentisphaeria bacterium]|nr:tRNA (guanosine(37)-N1)-methyltransferase TrmD [Lentisphaeria bacterium]
MKIDVLTLFPEIFPGPLGSSIIGRAIEAKKIEVNPIDLRNYAHDRHKTVDDKPYGGGPGMLMKADVLFEALTDLKKDDTLVILTTPRGEVFNQKQAERLSLEKHILFVCGHYEGVDQRFIDKFVDLELSIGDYVMTNGNLPAMVMIDALARLIPGVLGKDESSSDESFSNGLLEYPQYTRPYEIDGMRVPDVLISGNHAEIARWRLNQSKELTKSRRPDLYSKLDKNI